MPKFFKTNTFSLVPTGAPQSNASLGSPVTLTIPDDSTGALLQAFSEPVYYTIDGTTPTTSNGFLLSSSEGVVRFDLYPGAEIKVISISGELRWQFFRLSEGAL